MSVISRVFLAPTTPPPPATPIQSTASTRTPPVYTPGGDHVLIYPKPPQEAHLSSHRVKTIPNALRATGKFLLSPLEVPAIAIKNLIYSAWFFLKRDREQFISTLQAIPLSVLAPFSRFMDVKVAWRQTTTEPAAKFYTNMAKEYQSLVDSYFNRIDGTDSWRYQEHHTPEYFLEKIGDLLDYVAFSFGEAKPSKTLKNNPLVSLWANSVKTQSQDRRAILQVFLRTALQHRKAPILDLIEGKFRATLADTPDLSAADYTMLTSGQYETMTRKSGE